MLDYVIGEDQKMGVPLVYVSRALFVSLALIVVLITAKRTRAASAKKKIAQAYEDGRVVIATLDSAKYTYGFTPAAGERNSTLSNDTTKATYRYEADGAEYKLKASWSENIPNVPQQEYVWYETGKEAKAHFLSETMTKQEIEALINN